jgi:hypothetical protein
MSYENRASAPIHAKTALDAASRMTMKRRLMSDLPLFAFVFLALCTHASAKEWYEKHCTPTQIARDGSYYVGGTYNKHHAHVGSTFVSIYSANNNSTPVNKNKANCAVLNQAIADVVGGGYDYPGDVSTCLIAACVHYCDWNPLNNTCQ